MKTSAGIAVCLLVLVAVLPGASRPDGNGRHAPTNPRAQDILNQFRQEHGFIPKALSLMGERAGILPAFMTYGRGVLEGGPLTDKERSLVALGAAVALKSPECTLAHGQRARQYGATHDEVIQATLIAGLISNTSALHIAHASLGGMDK